MVSLSAVEREKIEIVVSDVIDRLCTWNIDWTKCIAIEMNWDIIWAIYVAQVLQCSTEAVHSDQLCGVSSALLCTYCSSADEQ